MHYSASNNTFYPDEFREEFEQSGSWPADAKPVPVKLYDGVRAAEAAGKRIAPGVGGLPIAVDPAAPTAAEIWEHTKTERDRRKSGGFKVATDGGDKWFHSDADSRIQHLGLKDKARDLIAAGGAMTDNLSILGQPVRWKTMDGSFATITAQLAFDIVAAAVALDARLFAVAEVHRVAMETAADPSSYDFSAGWPETFGG